MFNTCRILFDFFSTKIVRSTVRYLLHKIDIIYIVQLWEYRSNRSDEEFWNTLFTEIPFRDGPPDETWRARRLLHSVRISIESHSSRADGVGAVGRGFAAEMVMGRRACKRKPFLFLRPSIIPLAHTPTPGDLSRSDGRFRTCTW
jgi:hypothetical protein